MINFSTFLKYEIFFIPSIYFIIITCFTFIFFKEIQVNLFNYEKLKFKYFLTIYKTSINSYINFLYILIKIYLLYIIFLIFNSIYFYSYSNLKIFYSFQITNYIWLNSVIFIIISFFTFLILYKLINLNYFNSFEIWLAIFYLFLTSLYYFFFNNIIAFFFIFEIQSLLLLYSIIVSWNVKNFKKNKNYIQYLNNYSYYFTAILLQFWISFFSSIIFIFGLLFLIQNSMFIEWDNIQIFSFFFKNTIIFNNSIVLGWWLIIFSIFLKLGIIPVFLWKPEIYKFFNSIILFIYMTFYFLNILLFFIFFIYYYINLLFDWFTNIFFFSIFCTFLIVPIFFFSITELRSFLAISSIIQISYILLCLIYSNYFSISIAFLYSFIYYSYIIFFFILIFSLKNWNFWFISDFQFITNIRYLLTGFSILFLGLAGIPPFLGFLIKLSVIAFLFKLNEYILIIIILVGSYFSAYFYWQIIRFTELNIKKYTFNQFINLTFNNYFFFLLILLILINIFSYIFFIDFFNFSMFLTLNI